MSAPVFSSRRTFRVWVYTVSHATLLLRSVKGGAQTTRVDIVFKPVRFVSLPTVQEGLEVRLATRADLLAAHPGAASVCGDDDKVFALETRGLGGWIVSGVMGWHEDHGGDHDASHFSIPRATW